jgi:hypothetical protein
MALKLEAVSLKEMALNLRALVERCNCLPLAITAV